MIRDTKRFFILLVCVIVCGLFVGWLLEDNTTATVRFEELDQPPLRQAARNRTWKRTPKEAVWRVGGEDNQALLYGPINLKVDARGIVYVIDYGDLSVKSFSPEGRFLTKFGHGRGQGPGEFSSITDLSVDLDGGIMIVDQSNGRITKFDPMGRFVKTLRLQMPYRVVVEPMSGRLVVMLPPGASHLFGLFDPDGKPLRSFGRFLAKQEENSIALDGWIEPTTGGGFVYAPLYAGFIASYSKEGRPRFLVETVDPNPLPKIVKGAEAMWISGDAEIETQSLSVDHREIYLLSSISNGPRLIGTIDAYDTADGRYLYSRRLPEACSWALVRKGFLYTATDTRVTKWRL